VCVCVVPQAEIAWLRFFSRGSILISSLLAVGIAHKVARSWLQESMLFILFGAFIATAILLIEQGNVDVSTEVYSVYFAFDPDVFFYLLLPPIILDAAYNIPAKSNFFYNFSAIMCFAFIGTIISTIIIGTGIWLFSVIVQQNVDSGGAAGGDERLIGYERVTWAFKLGSMLSATDPVATLSVLGSFGALKDPHLHNLIFGESILNDAVAIVLFEEFDRAAKNADDAEDGMGAEGWILVLQGVGTFFWVTAASLALGAVIGALAAIVTRWWWIRGVVHAEIIVCIVLPYMAYVVAEAVDISGIMSLFVCGMMMSHYTRYNITPQAEAVTTHGFHALAWVAEAAVFTYLGADFLLADFQEEAWDMRVVGVVIPLCLIARACSIFPIANVINCRRSRVGRSEPKICWQSQVVLWFAGLRGAIAYGLAKRWDAEPCETPTHSLNHSTTNEATTEPAHAHALPCPALLFTCCVCSCI
jgi:sodium/hydrogen exchanger 8